MHLGIIGFGAIARGVLDGLGAADAPAPGQITLLVRPGRAAQAAAALAGHRAAIRVVEETGALVAARPDLVAECAGHGAVADHVPPLLRAGIDCIVVSVGALADDALRAGLGEAARAGGARVILPAGAVGGIDILAAVAAAGDARVTYRGTKPPRAWAGTAAERAVALDRLTGPTVFFTGTAREAARDYPKNANVAATIALAGAGLDATRVELVADPGAAGNSHVFELHSPVARCRVEIENVAAPGNPRTSMATILSVLREIRNRVGWMAI
ncbi:MAG: aspartate dehydrogenase [Alphaproteobacteria bacterium]|nr:MAG: aspartate dehydrogenase [Alphaproteobacteria bacterium]